MKTKEDSSPIYSREKAVESDNPSLPAAKAAETKKSVAVAKRPELACLTEENSPENFVDAAIALCAYVQRGTKVFPPTLSLHFDRGGKETFQALVNPAKRAGAIDAILATQIVRGTVHGQIADIAMSLVNLGDYPEQLAAQNSPLNCAIRTRQQSDREVRSAIAALRKIGGPQVANFTLRNAETVNIAAMTPPMPSRTEPAPFIDAEA